MIIDVHEGQYNLVDICPTNNALSSDVQDYCCQMSSFTKEKQKEYASQMNNEIVPEVVKCCQITSLTRFHVY